MKDNICVFPNYLESINAAKAIEIIETSDIQLDGVSINIDLKVDVEPSILIKNVDEGLFEVIKKTVGGSGIYDKRRNKGYLFNFGRYFNPCLSIEEMQKSRIVYKTQEKQYF